MAVVEVDQVALLVGEHAPLAERVVGSMASSGIPKHVPRDDLRSAAYFALFQAATRFDEELGVPFEHYAARRIRGAVLDELRSWDWATRTTRTRVRQVDLAAERLTQRLGRSPNLTELAEELGVGVGEVAASQHDDNRAAVLQLDGLYVDHHGDLPLACERPGPEVIVIDDERERLIEDAIDSLPTRHGAVIRGYYYDGRKLLDLAGDFGVTESRVCQIRAEGIKALREALEDVEL
jgi:RNA polymerase sigma factor FliA